MASRRRMVVVGWGMDVSMGENEDLGCNEGVGREGGQPSASVAVSDSPEGKFSGSSQNKHMELYTVWRQHCPDIL